MTEPAVVSTRPRAAFPEGRAGDAFRLARRRFIAGERLDMSQLAGELGVDRVTLFRWVGNRDQLTADVIISLADPTIRRAAEAAKGAGGARIAAVAGDYAQVLIDSPFFQTFVRREPERSLRLLTSAASPVQRFIVRSFEWLLERERDGGALEHTMALHDLAYLIVRIIESFIYSDIIIGEPPDATKVRAAIAALLHAD
ncbi:QsdR family transcriptional regulator [Dactylosporangium sp. CA-092794]|uniref:QsdR family transcriptional regulator n=1 Tax=Dactylosporangium sp. CA-092794 TaxID=3239929 RepID=UPI003D8B3BA1